ncbi:ubiquitin-like small modifier protein 1 [Halovivax gelatinilyticus]|uniref:ubiquitin-like small modifier protein 1 n=1 Tax=Halovivax gelatinilyticus TaxID=2961597 RepID=UPI0020CA2EDF|nr:ubiquitin-like small modifier protein 1 [Halovivax gelatinilyticus]
MELTLRFFATYREAVGTKELVREFDEESTVGDVLEALESEFEGLSGQLLADGSVRPQVNVLQNGRNVVHEEDVETRLESGDEVSVFPPVAGG